MIGLVRNEWKKVFLPVLLTTVLLAIAMSVLSCTIYQNYTLHYDLEAWEVGTELFSLLYPLFVVVPLCWNLYYERKNNFLLYVMPRVKIKKYLTAKWIAYALGTLCIIVIPYILSAVFALYVKPPVVPFVENPFIRISTANRYQLMVEQYTIPRIGSIKLTKLTAHDLQKLYKDLMENGRIDRKSGHGNPGLSSTTVRSLHLMLHSAFERAVKERLILRNPTEDCIAPKVQKIEMQILSPEHIKDYLEAADRRGLLPMFYLELVTGLRKGEITALLWSDLDIQNKTISVSKQYIKNPNGELTLSRPKTETSVRKVSIPQEAVDLLIAEHGKHPENPYMFPSPATGEMYYPDSVVNLHKKILKDAGLPHIRFHDLRHTFATLALQNGVDVKTVSSMLGHYDAGFTLRTYTHATRQKQDEAAQTMGSFMAQVM